MSKSGFRPVAFHHTPDPPLRHPTLWHGAHHVADGVGVAQPNVARAGTASRARSAIDPGHRPATIVTITHMVRAMVAPAGTAILGPTTGVSAPAASTGSAMYMLTAIRR